MTSRVSRLNAVLIAITLAISGLFSLNVAAPAEAATLTQPHSNPVTFPGTIPSAPSISLEGTAATIHNNSIKVSLDFSDGVAIKKVYNSLTNTDVPFSADQAFSFTYDGKIISLSDFERDGDASIVDIAPQMNTGSFADTYAGKAVVQAFKAGEKTPKDLANLRLVYRAELLEGSNYVRQVLEFENKGTKALDITNVTLVDAQVTGRVMGRDDGSPIVLGTSKAETAWIGGENPLAKVSVVDGHAQSTLRRAGDLVKAEPWEISTTIGVSPDQQLRRAFSYYLERERARSRRTFLHFQSWFDLKPTGSKSLMIKHDEMLAAEQMFFNEMNKRDAAVDSYWVDDGWDYLRDPQQSDESKLNVWDFDPVEFKDGFTKDLEVMKTQGAKLSVWMSPFGGYGESANRRAQIGNSKLDDSDSANDAWANKSKVMRLSDPVYYEYFKNKVFYMIDHGVVGFKFDGIAKGNLFITGATDDLIADYEKLFELMQAMRAKNKDVWINATVGTWGSPYWFWYADSIYRDGNDAGQTGQGDSTQKYINYRDQQVYQNMIVENPLVPLNSVMNHGVILSDRTDGQIPNQAHDFSQKSVRDAFSADLKNFFSMGIGLQELYLRSTFFDEKKIGADNATWAWNEIAKNAKWARENVELLTDTHWLGGSPQAGKVYGTAAWHNPTSAQADAKAMIAVRNPSAAPAYIAVDAAKTLEVPAGQIANFKFVERDGAADTWVSGTSPYYIELDPFEVLIFEGTPTTEQPTPSQEPEVDPCYTQISQSEWSITVDSQQATGNEIDLGTYAIDNDPSTFWHTQWDPTKATYPHEALVDMGRINTVCRIGYLPRATNANGDIKTYDLQVSKDKQKWETIVTNGTFPNDKNEKYIDIPEGKRDFQYFKLVAKNAQNGQDFAGAAELRAYGTLGKSEWLEQNTWNCSASDYEATGEKNGASGWAKHACDDDVTTQWHSQYNPKPTSMPHWLQVDLGSMADISAFKYTPRQDAYPANGIVKDYKVEYSTDGQKWTSAKNGTLTDGKPAVIDFGKNVRARYVRFTASSAQNGQAFAGAAEVDVKGAYVELTPQKPTFTDANGSDNDTYTIPKQEGVRYLINGNAVEPGVHTIAPGQTSVQITAGAADGWRLSDGEWSWEGTFSSEPSAPDEPDDPATPLPSPSAQTVRVTADTTLQSWKNEKVTSMAAKPYIGALRPAETYGTFGEKFVSTDTSEGTDAKMGLMSFDLSAYDEMPEKVLLNLTYIGYRGTVNATDMDTVKVMAVDTETCTNNSSSCPPSSATWATRPRFSSDGAKIATSDPITLSKAVVYTGDSITIDPAQTVQVSIDVTDIVKEQFAAGKNTVTFALQEAKGKEIRFASSEGASSLQGAKPEMAPSLTVTPKQKAYLLNIKTAPKTNYALGEKFDPAGIVVTATDTATGKTVELKESEYRLDSSAFDKDNVGGYPIKVTLIKDTSITSSFNAYVVSNPGDADDGDTSGDDVMWYSQSGSQTANGNIGSGTVSGDNDKWQRVTLPIGNGKVGGTVWGEVGKERITFNEETLWTGGPGSTPDYNGGNNNTKGRDGATLRELNKQLEEGAQTVNPGDLTGGEKANEQGAYQNWGNLYIDYGFGANPTVTNYKRSLNLSKGKVDVDFTREGVDYSREFFVSNPDDVMVVRLSANEAKALNLNVTFPTNAGFSKKGESTSVAGDTLTVKGALGNNGLLYDAKIKAVVDGGVGTVGAGSGDSLKISGASGVTLYIAAATNYKQTYPTYRNGENASELDARVASYVQKAANKGYAAVKKAHVADHAKYYDRVNIDLGQDASTSIATDQLLNAYKNGSASAAQKRTLEMLIYQYGRYLTIGSSREDSQLPSNLQGIWSSTAGDNAHGTTPWGSDFHMNVNLQMNYWPTYSGNLAELAKPVIDYAQGLVEPGRVTAATYAGAKTASGTAIGEGKGYMAHTENTAYGWTAPGHTFSWGWSPAAMPWLLQNVYEAYEFSADDTYLKETIYPLLKEEANFYVDYMLHKGGQKAADGTYRLTTGVAYSPEHGPQGTDGNTYESSLVWQLLNDAIEAADVLGADKALAHGTGTCEVGNWAKDNSGAFTDADANRSWECALSLLKPIEVGKSGQIKEWFFEGEFGKMANGSAIAGYQNNHRHLSHLLGLFPGDLVTIDDATYMDAAKVSLTNRGDDATGWGVGQRLNAWARTGDGNHAYQLIEKQIKNAMYPNLFDAHPPFQIDGNFGNTSGVNEMLLQSNSTFTHEGKEYANYMNLLPALPDAWKASGAADGLVARGNFVVNMEWKDAKISDLALTSNKGKLAVLKFAGADKVFIKDQTAGAYVDVTVLDSEHITFNTQAGHTYVLAEEPPATHKVSFSGEGVSAQDYPVLLVEDGSVIAKPENDPVREGFTFDGWFAQDADVPFDFGTPIGGDTVLTAHWTQTPVDPGGDPEDPSDPDPSEPSEPPAPSDPSDPSNPSDPSESSEGNVPSGDTGMDKPSGDRPSVVTPRLSDTGSHTLWAMLGALTLVLGGTVLAARRRHA